MAVMISDMLSYLPWHWIDMWAILLFTTVLIVSKYIIELPPKGSPPGPLPLPIIGNLLGMADKDPIASLNRLVDIYGDVISIGSGSMRCVLLSGYKGFKEAFVEKADSFTDRPPNPLYNRLNKSLGLIASNGHMWRQQRRFTLFTLKYFGVGKTTLENSILEESQLLCEVLQAEQGSPYDPHVLLNNAVANIVCTLVFGHRFEYDDQHFHYIMKCSDEVLQLPITFWGQLYNEYPKLMNYLPGKHQTVFFKSEQLKRFIIEEVERHKENRIPSNPRDYIDCYLEEIEKNKDETAGFNEENLIYCLMDLLAAGTETTANSLKWAMLYMAKYTTIQEKVRSEIDKVIGPSRQPTMADRPNMPYTSAVIHEILRCGSIVPFTPARVTNKDTTISGFHLRKGTVVLPMLKPILHDKNAFAVPDQFHPEHFLDENGSFLKRESFIPFSIGKRMCPGEQLARMELFLFFTSILQRFTLCGPKGLELTLKSQVAITCGPKPFKICAVSV